MQSPGATWRRENTNGDIRYIGAMYFLSDSVGWAVGGNTKIFYTTTGGLTFIKNENIGIINQYKLHQNFPNPFNPETKIKFDLPVFGNVKLSVYNILGKEIKVLLNERLSRGSYELTFDGTDFAGGIYFYRIISDNFLETKSMVLLK